MDEIENTGRRPRPRAAAAGADDHPDLERLLAYRDGELGEAEADEAQEHLSLCPDCALLLLEFDQFRTDAEAGERGASEAARAGAWEALQAELRKERAEMPTLALPVPPSSAPVAPALLPFQPAARPPAPPRALYALAAVLALVALGLGLALAWSQSQYRAEMRALEESRREAEELRTRLSEAQERAPAPAPEGPAPAPPAPPPGDRLAGRPSKPPGLSAPPGRPEPPAPERPDAASALAVAVGPWLTTRGENASPTPLQGGGAANLLSPGSDGRLLLGFDPGPALEREKAKLTLLDANGRTLWSGERLSAVLQGDLGTAAALSGLAPGRYRLRLEAVGGGASDSVEYQIEVGGGG